jgi:hypothetical protein
MSWFLPVLHENNEMLYQLEQAYRFDCSKQETRWAARELAKYGNAIRCRQGQLIGGMVHRVTGPKPTHTM